MDYLLIVNLEIKDVAGSRETFSKTWDVKVESIDVAYSQGFQELKSMISKYLDDSKKIVLSSIQCEPTPKHRKLFQKILDEAQHS